MATDRRLLLQSPLDQRTAFVWADRLLLQHPADHAFGLALQGFSTRFQVALFSAKAIECLLSRADATLPVAPWTFWSVSLAQPCPRHEANIESGERD